MNELLNLADIHSRVDLPKGEAVVLLDRLGKGDQYNKEDLARNVFRIDSKGHIMWRVSSAFDKLGDPFTRLYSEDGTLTAYRWDGGSYVIDLETGSATPLRLER
ncbi:hypothetical protein [Hyphomonas chukchiensis]|uniref:hypothetical protein n=1 Tax=Hyphomonas chukchiensis TaxID=1280947 RepID=UPI0012DE5DD9|nr:hypothetical protein [Hyphomonas chukchiensis]